VKILMITWLDAVASGDEWVSDTHETAIINTCGFFHKESEKDITLVLSISPDELIRGYVSIPKSCIVESKLIAEC
jgi:hypothetical protein